VRIFGLIDAVVLLDEADVFLEERSLDNLQRNALVSVFLRIIEYFDGKQDLQMKCTRIEPRLTKYRDPDLDEQSSGQI
jgi:hypothetical protein